MTRRGIITSMVIDFHTHVFPPGIVNNRERYLKLDAAFASLYSQPRSKLATTEELIASMDEKEVERSVILNFGWGSHELCVETNDYIMECLARYPKRLTGFAAIQPLAGDRALAEVERCLKGGIKGLGELRPDTQAFGPSHLEPLAELIEKHGLILLFHSSEPVGHQYPGKGMCTPAVLYEFVVRFPRLRFVLAHWGGGLPFYALMPEVTSAMGNVFFDTAASPLLYQPQVFSQVASLVGGERILFGSDFPLIPQSKIVSLVRASSLPSPVKDMILGGNARKLLGLD